MYNLERIKRETEKEKNTTTYAIRIKPSFYFIFYAFCILTRLERAPSGRLNLPPLVHLHLKALSGFTAQAMRLSAG